jgi:hypothetical protein
MGDSKSLVAARPVPLLLRHFFASASFETGIHGWREKVRAFSSPMRAGGPDLN